MTAQVAVLNPNGIALASDSAVTITGGKQERSYLSADKIWPIEKVPVAVLHSGTTSIWQVPWQLLIEGWSKSRGGVQAPTLEAYVREFQDWLPKQNFVTEALQDQTFRQNFRTYLLWIRSSIRDALNMAADAVDARYVKSGDSYTIDSAVDEFAAALITRADYPGLDAASSDVICERLDAGLRADIEWAFDDTPRTSHVDSVALELGHTLVYKAQEFNNQAVLAFAGYGADEFFPSIHSITVSDILGGVVRIFHEFHDTVSADARVSIVPLGMTGAIQTFLRGTSPQYRAAAHSALDKLAKEASDSVETDVDVDAIAPVAAHEALDEDFDDIEWKQYLSPMLNIVETLPVAESLRLADSLVGLSSLRQLIQGDSSVGGPVDLARLTKHGGFEWVRNKHVTAEGLFVR